MDDAVDRKAQELREQRAAADQERERAKQRRSHAMEEFWQTLLSIHGQNTRYPIALVSSPRSRDRRRVVFFTIGPNGTVTERELAEVEAYTYGVSDIPAQIFLTSPSDESEQPRKLGTLPAETARRVATIAVAEMGKAVARGANIISLEEVETLQTAREREREERECEQRKAASARYDREHRWDWLGGLITSVGVILLMRFVLYPMIRPFFE